MTRIAPSVSPRLEFFVTDATGAAVPSLTHANVTSAAYVLITAGVRAAAVAVTLTSSVAATAAIAAQQFVTINSVRGHYAVDCPAGAALSTADSVELSIVMVTGTQLVYPVSHAIDATVSSRLAPTVSGRTLSVSAAGLGAAELDAAYHEVIAAAVEAAINNENDGEKTQQGIADKVVSTLAVTDNPQVDTINSSVEEFIFGSSKSPIPVYVGHVNQQ